MQACSQIDLIIAVTRAIVLVICALSGSVSIFLGVRLYQQTISSRSSGELSAMGMKVVLKSSGPGLFLIAFGVIVLLALVSRPASFDDTIGQSAVRHAVARGDSSCERPMRSTVAWTPTAAVGAVGGMAPAASAPAARECLVYVRHREFGSGKNLLARPNIEWALATAIDGLRTGGASGIGDPGQRVDVIQTLSALRESMSEN